MELNILKGKLKSIMGDNLFIYIMRHGRTEWNAQGKLQGRLNSPLLPESVQSLRRIGGLLRSRGIESVYSSPLERCRQSAGIICGILDKPAVFIDDLVECDHGKCEGLSVEESKITFSALFYEREFGDKWNIKWPGGESYSDVASRVERAINEMDLLKPTLIIAHETVNKVLSGLLLGFSREEIMLRNQKNNEIFRINLITKSFDVINC